MASIREQKNPTASIQELAHLLNSMHVVDLSPLLYTNMPHWHRHPDVFIVEDARNFAQNGYFLQTIILPEHDCTFPKGIRYPYCYAHAICDILRYTLVMDPGVPLTHWTQILGVWSSSQERWS